MARARALKLLRNLFYGPGSTGSVSAIGADRLTGPILLLASVLLGFGLWLPFMVVTRFFVLEDEISVLGGIAALAGDGEWLLALVLALFSVVFPLLKIGVALYAWRKAPVGDAQVKTMLRRLDVVSRWSMLDVMVAALAVLSAKVSGVALAASQPGLYCFFAAVLLSALAVRRLDRALRRHG